MVVITVLLFATNVELAAITIFGVLPLLIVDVDLVPPGVRAGLRQGPRRHRPRAGRSLREPPGRCASSRRTTASATTSRPTATSSARTATPTTTRAASPASTGRGHRHSACSARCSSWASAGYMFLHKPQEINLGQLTAFFLYVNRFFAPIQLLTQQYNTFQQGRASIFKLRDLLETEPSVLESTGRRRAPADPRRDPLRPRLLRLRPRRPGPARRRPDDRRRARRWPSSAPPARASRPWRSWSPASTTRPQGRVLIDGYDLRKCDARVAALAAGRRAPGAVPLRRDDPRQHLVRPARRRRRRGVERRPPGGPRRTRAAPALRARHAGARAGPVVVLGRAPADRAGPGLHGRAPGARPRRGDVEPRPQVRDARGGRTRRAARGPRPRC